MSKIIIIHVPDLSTNETFVQMKKIFLTATILSMFTSLNAQFTMDYLRAADEYFHKADYYSAAQYYEKYLGLAQSRNKDATYNPYTLQKPSSKKMTGAVSSRHQAIYNTAESYRMLNYHIKAEPFYRQVVEFDKAQFPLARYWHAVELRALERYDEAEAGFTTFLSEYPTKDKYTEAAVREVNNLRFIKSQLAKKDIDQYTVANAGAGLSDTGAVYAPVWVNNTTLLFTSTRPDNSAAKNDMYTNRVYQAVYTDGVLGAVSKAGLPEVADIHQGVVSLTPDGNTIFLTRWTVGKGTKTASIYSSKKTNNKWSEPMPVDAAVNTPGSNNQQPFVMPDGQILLFASDRPGGSGGFDLWSASLGSDGSLSNVTNLSSTINTNFDEQAPYYHRPSGNLVFSSNGRIGMGGFDFFSSKGNLVSFETPVNLGYPVNSVKDDIYFVSGSVSRYLLEKVLLSSDRNASCCLELFSLDKKRPLRQLSGIVIACDTRSPLPGVSVTITGSDNRNIATLTTDVSGRYTYTLPEYVPLKADAFIPGYYRESVQLPAHKIPDEESAVNPVICLNVIPVEKPIVIDNVYYEFNKADVMPESYPALDKLVALLNDNPKMRIELSAHTDSKGTDAYNIKLSDARASSVVQYLMSKGIDGSRLEAKGYGESMPIAPNENADGSDNPEGRQQNRRTEFKVLSK